MSCVDGPGEPPESWEELGSREELERAGRDVEQLEFRSALGTPERREPPSRVPEHVWSCLLYTSPSPRD
eukprot:10177752-Alexandrium_andersonii.AAC.1